MATLAAKVIRKERGQAVIEMALTLPLLLLVAMGIFDFGLMFQKYEVLTNAAREGARVGVLPDYTAPAATTSPLAQARALQYMSVGGLNGVIDSSAGCSGTFVAGQRCVSTVVSTVQVAPGPPPKNVKQITVTATLDYEFQFVGPMMKLFGGSLGNTHLAARSTMRME